MHSTAKGVMCVTGSMINNALCRLTSVSLVLFLPSMVESLGCSLAEGTLIFTIYAITAALISFVLGEWTVRYNPKVIHLVGALGVMSMFYGMAYAPNIQTIWVLSAFFGLSMRFNSSIPLQVLAINWFKTGQGTIITSSHILSGLVSATGSIVIGALIMHLGWQGAALTLGLFVGGVEAIIALTLICKVPSAYGMEPIEIKLFTRIDQRKQAKESATGGLQNHYEFAMPNSRLYRMPVFYLIVSCPLLLTITSQILYSNSSVIFGTMGIPTDQISILVSVFSIGGIVLVPLFGVLSDVFGAKRVLIVYCLIGAANMFGFLITKNMGFVGGFILAALYNVSGIRNYFGGVVTTPLFGVKKSAQLVGLCGVTASIGAGAAPTLSAALYEATGSYDLPMCVGGACFLLVIIAASIGMNDKTKRRLIEIDKPYKQALDSAEQR